MDLTRENDSFIQSSSYKSDKITDFLRNFKVANEFKYVERIDRSGNNAGILLNVTDLLENELLFKWITEEPKEFLELCSKAITTIFKERHQRTKSFDVYLDEMTDKISVVEALGNLHIGKIVTLTGIITSSTGLYNVPDYHTYVCPDGHKTMIRINKRPLKCGEPSCIFRELEENTPNEVFRQHRMLYLKSDEEFGYYGDELRIDTTGDLVNVADSGDRIKVTGIVQTIEIPRTRHFQNIIKCNNIKKLDDIDLSLSEDDMELFCTFPDESDFYQKCINSISPSIEGNPRVKESILLQIIGSPDRHQNDGTKIRGWLHCGLFGDPGTAKTKFCEWLTQSGIISRSQMVMSKGATATGLIIGLDDGPDGRKVLRTGAMVNCRDGGIVCIDEFPRLSADVIDALYTTSENGIASSAKTGNQASKVRADASLILTGNAHNGKWNSALSIQDNLSIDPTFLNRLDFIWIFNDEYGEKQDTSIAKAILYGTKYEEDVVPFSPKTLGKYIKFCRRINPELRKEEGELLEKTYKELRRDPQAKDNGISPRHLNTLIRLTLAGARLHQRRCTEPIDATRAITLVREMFKQRNISISYADSYVQRTLDKAIRVIKDVAATGLHVVDLYDRIMTYGTEEEQKQALADIGGSRELAHNRKWREVVEELKRSSLINIVSRKPLVLSYDQNKGDITKYG